MFVMDAPLPEIRPRSGPNLLDLLCAWSMKIRGEPPLGATLFCCLSLRSFLKPPRTSEHPQRRPRTSGQRPSPVVCRSLLSEPPRCCVSHPAAKHFLRLSMALLAMERLKQRQRNPCPPRRWAGGPSASSGLHDYSAAAMESNFAGQAFLNFPHLPPATPTRAP